MTDLDATVVGLARYSVKSMQGTACQSIDITVEGVDGDRDWALVDTQTGRLMSAKRYSALLLWSADRDGITVDGGFTIGFDDPGINSILSERLGRDVQLRRCGGGEARSYEMTFEPPNDDAEYIAIDAPPGRFVDLAPLHVLSQQTVDGCAEARPDLDWDVRRFRPNLVIDAPGLEPFGEDAWCGRRLRVGEVVLEPRQPTVRCAMPLRAQPGLARQPDLYNALEDLHANHLGIYVWVEKPGAVALGDGVALIS